MKQAFSLLLFLIVIHSIGAQVQTLDAPKSQAPTQDENSLLWQITGENLKDTSHLFGTIHMIGKEDFFLSKATKQAIQRAKLVTFEINMEDMTNIGTQLSLLSKAFMDNNLTIKDLLSEEDYTIVQNHFKKIGMPLFMLDRIKPMFLTVLADIDMSPTAMASGEIVSYEMEILEMAKAQEAAIGGLETAEYQMSMFDSIPYEAQAQMLVEGIKSVDEEGDDQFEKMVEMYKNQDIEAMGNILSDEEEGMAEFENLLLVQRNKNWIPIMGEMMEKQRTFFAVGAGHLGGKMGVIALLREAGYELVPLFGE